MVLLIPTPAPQIPRYAVEKRQGLGGIITSIVDGLGGGGTTSDGSGNTGGGSDDGGSTAGTGGGSTGGSTGGGSTAATGGSTGAGSTANTSTTARATSTSNPSTAAATTTSRGQTSATENTAPVVTQVTSTVNGGGVVVVSSTLAPTSTGQAEKSGSSTTRPALIGGVVGGVVGGLALLTALILILVVWKRRKSRTGSGWFLCFGTRPKRGNKDFDVDWPTFDPTVGAAGVGGTMGSRSGRGRTQAGAGGTLPDVDDDYNQDVYSNDGEMRDVGSGTHSGSYNNYYGAPSSQNGYSAGGPQSTSYGRSDEGHFRGGGGWAAMPGAGAAGVASAAHTEADTVPTYDHLDPPEVREDRAREQAEAQAQAMAAYSANGHPSSSPPPIYPQHSPGYYPASSPPAPSQRPISDHRLSTGTTQALAANQYFDPEQDPNTGTVQSDQQRMLHLHNPDA